MYVKRYLANSMPTMQVFYPFVLFYMVAAFLQGGAGTASMGMLNNLRQYLWIPITQDAYR